MKGKYHNKEAISNWKGPGLDQINNFWKEHLHALHLNLAEWLNEIFLNPELIPEWMIRYKTEMKRNRIPIEEEQVRSALCHFW